MLVAGEDRTVPIRGYARTMVKTMAAAEFARWYQQTGGLGEEGLVLDPVYTAKSFAAIPALVASGEIPKGSKVCFVHTGGLAALFAYEAAIAGRL